MQKNVNIVDWYEYDDRNNYNIMLYGRTIDNDSIAIKVMNFRPYIYIYVNIKNCTKEDYEEINEENIDLIDKIINKIIDNNKKSQEGKNNRYKDDEIEFKLEIVEKIKLYGFTDNKLDKFIKISFSSYKNCKKIINMIKCQNKSNDYEFTHEYTDGITSHRKKFLFELYEADIPPIFRFMHEKEVYPCGWIKIDKYEEKKNDKILTKEMIETDYTNINGDKNNNKISKIKICSFDIECTSHDENMFPKAIIKEDTIIQIGLVFNIFGENNFKNYIVTLDSCSEIENTIVISVETEIELLEKFVEIIQKEDPDILVGYNIFGFDMAYIYDRAILVENNFSDEALKCYIKDIYEFNIDNVAINESLDSYIKSKSFNDEIKKAEKIKFSRPPPKFKNFNKFRNKYKSNILKLSRYINYPSKFCENVLSSSALGYNEIKFIETIGRVQIDLYKVITKDYKLPSYKLDSVAEYFIKGSISNITKDEVKKCYILKAKNLTNVSVNNYFRLEIDGDLYDEKIKIIEKDNENLYISIENEKILKNITPEIMEKQIKNKEDKIYWCLVKDDLKANKMFKLQKGSADDRKIIAEYCIQDCVLVSKLLDKLYILLNHIGMANVCIVPLSYLFLRGQGITTYSLVSKFTQKFNYLIPTLNKGNDVESEEDTFEGAYVFDPITGLYKDPIAVLDYNSLYPNTIISMNISHETLVNDIVYDNLPEYEYSNIVFREGTRNVTCRFAKKKNGELGVIPKILQNLLSERKRVKNLEENENDPFMKRIYNGHQLALKVKANSIYGQLGARTSSIYKRELAACTTAMGRKMLEIAQNFVENDFYSILKYYTSKDKINVDNNQKIIIQYLENNQIEKQKLIDFANDFFIDKDIKPKTIYGDTDSIFVNFNIYQNGIKLQSKDAVTYSIQLATIASDYINRIVLKPHKIEYEKTFWPLIISGKKHYSGNKYTSNNTKFYRVDMGNVLKRRDGAKIVKKIVAELVTTILNEMDIEKAIINLKKNCIDLLTGKVCINDMVISKTLSNDYKDRTKHAHVVLADRIAERDPGNKPNVNDRIPFVYIIYNDNKKKKSKEKVLQGELIEHPDYVTEKNLKIDYLYYLENKVKSACIEFLKVIYEDPDSIFDEIIQEQKRINNKNTSMLDFIKCTKIINPKKSDGLKKVD